MRPLTETETHTLFRKLADYTSSSLSSLLQQPTSAPTPSNSTSKPATTTTYTFRIHQSRVYHLPVSLANLATSIPRHSLLSLGTCIGKFTKTGKFRIHITALDVLAPHARYKVWVKANGEMPFLYGGNCVKAHVGRWSEGCPGRQGVVVLSMDGKALGFGVTARSTAEARRLEPTGTVVYRQGDVGEYLREEDSLFVT